ncbi:MAG TPA: tRNA adenosine(34) deaminase TadA [Coxiellaceae bacterium]|nr:tRNA adenosine(34) deaminase TadA [Coxiellaceae bacterium]
MTDLQFMRRALELAQQAKAADEVPVGAVLVLDNQIIGEGYNQSIKLSDPTAHAEIIALRAAGLQHQNYRLLNTTLYVSLEPCAMCLGALQHARIAKLIYGASDSKTGAVESVYQLLDQPLNHRICWEKGLLSSESAELLRTFFRERR